ncbi:MAG TPA: DUF4382 domain-containing protein [Anaeromyxobacteraceae bacterium]|nr:DUF4382 domain-containing protein [Anaeromyxobacteraceae bacterium]
MQVRAILAAAILGTFLGACGSGTSTTTPTMNVYLVDAPSQAYAQVNVDVQKVEIASDSGWITLGTPNRVVDLLTLTGGVTGGVTATLVNGAPLPAGHYGQMRLVLGTRNSVRLLDGTVEPLTVPSGQQSGVKLTVSFDVQAGTTYDVYIDFDAHNSIFVHEAGASGKYILRPTVRAYGLPTGSISGTLTVAGGTTPLAGVEVTAQTVTAGSPAVVRSTFTDAAGHYVLDLLRRDGTYFVVSQPLVTDAAGAPVTSYEPKASGGFTITAASPDKTWDAAFTAASAVGAIGGPVTPVATTSQADSVDVQATLDAGGTPQPFILRTVAAVVASGAESYTVAALPTVTAGQTYTVVGTRRTVDALGAESFVQTDPITAIVMPATTTLTPVSFGP